MPKKDYISKKRLLDLTFIELYKYGYNGLDIPKMLEDNGILSQTMYSHFDSKKTLVLAMIEDTLFPRVRNFMTFDNIIENDAFLTLKIFVLKMSQNNLLISYGCPVHRLMFETAETEPAISHHAKQEFLNIKSRLIDVIKYGQERSQIIKEDPSVLAEFFILSLWGFLLIPAKDSSAERFWLDAQNSIARIKHPSYHTITQSKNMFNTYQASYQI